MIFKGKLVKKNFKENILPHNFEASLLNGSPFHLYVADKTFYLDVKCLKFLDKKLVFEGIIADQKNVYGRCLIEFYNG
jgi:hypothetical protein